MQSFPCFFYFEFEKRGDGVEEATGEKEVEGTKKVWSLSSFFPFFPFFLFFVSPPVTRSEGKGISFLSFLLFFFFTFYFI